ADSDEILNSGDALNMEFSLTRDDNVYQWTLNGKDVPLAVGKNYTVGSFAAEHAGVYRCKITNPNLEGVELYSGDFARFLSKEGNNAPIDIAITHDPVQAGTPSFAIIGDFTATDADGDEVFFRIKGGVHASSFRIIEGKTLITAEDMFPIGAPETYDVVIEAYDVFGGKSEKTLSITKGEGSTEAFPKDILLSANSVDENSIAEIGELTAVGVEGFSFELPEVKDNNKFIIEGSKLKTSEKLDYEVKSTYSIRVKASKEATSLTKDFAIKVIDANDTPSDIVLSANRVNIGNTPGSIVGYLVAVDQDPGDKDFTFTTTSSKFFIENNVLKTKVSFKEAGGESLTIKVKDSDDAEYSKGIDVQIVDPSTGSENNVPTAIGLNNFIVKRDWTSGTQVSLLLMKDIDGDQGEFSIEDGDDSEYFIVEGYKLLLNKELGDKTVYTITIIASDGDATYSEEFSFYIPVVVNGIDNINAKDIVRATPNPVSTNLYLEYEGDRGIVKFYNTSGALVKAEVISDVVDCSDLDTGLYIVKATVDNKTTTFKIIKQ
ncbi:MAG: T9SS type A sorting domain-containing protein, partial [Bacteroidales bacterium]|nr:T9SS type A sorting domain-containing protein [Bacteroidales bacterium]